MDDKTNEDGSFAKRIAKDYLNASGLGMDMMMAVGGGAESLFNHVPESLLGPMNRAVGKALEKALCAADKSRKATGNAARRVERYLPGITGALGGLTGLPGAFVDVPVTITVILRGVLDEAENLGFSPDEDEVRKEALRVFSMGGPFSEDDGADMALIVTKASMTGQTVSGLLQAAIPRLASALGPKLMAQSVPLIGAVSGAAINTIFASYYREMARVRFAIMRESLDRGVSQQTVAEEVAKEVDAIRPARRSVKPE